MDLSTGSLAWHRTRRWLDAEIERLYTKQDANDLTPEQREYLAGFRDGMFAAYGRVRQSFNTREEDAEAEKTRREMFGCRMKT